MATEIPIVVPALPESVANATVVNWHAKPGQAISQEMTIVDLETDKIVMEVPSPADGTLLSILVETGTTVVAGQHLAMVQVSAKAETKAKQLPEDTSDDGPIKDITNEASAKSIATTIDQLPPGARFTALQANIDPAVVKGTGRADAVTKEDLLTYQAQQPTSASPQTDGQVDPSSTAHRIAMPRIRQRIAERMLLAKQTTAMLTTFNEINLDTVNALRHRCQEEFQSRNGVKLGMMSFFVKATAHALLRFPSINASIDGTDIIYHHHCDISIAVATDKGLVTPVLRRAEDLSFAQIEQQITELANQARSNQLPLDALLGGTFTITNGGTFGSLLSTPIINPPQSAILGMHTIQERPIAENGQVRIAPMMYVALTYDHRLIDGKDAVRFLVDIKKQLEHPERMLLSL